MGANKNQHKILSVVNNEGMQWVEEQMKINGKCAMREWCWIYFLIYSAHTVSPGARHREPLTPAHSLHQSMHRKKNHCQIVRIFSRWKRHLQSHLHEWKCKWQNHVSEMWAKANEQRKRIIFLQLNSSIIIFVFISVYDVILALYIWVI